MDDHEVKYIPTKDSNFLPMKCKKWIQLKNRKSNNQLSFIISILSLLVALCFFALLFTWLWGVPEKVSQNEERIDELEHRLQVIPNIEQNNLQSNQKMESICVQDKQQGGCFASMPRWYFDNGSKMCKQFTYSGCDGNGNNFHTEDACLTTCRDIDIKIDGRSSINKETKGNITL